MKWGRNEIERAAGAIYDAEIQRMPIEPLSAKDPEMGEAEAYAIQLENVDRVLKSGKRVVGYKIGLTSRHAQKQFGVFQPDFGHLYDSMSVLEDGEIELADLIQPKIESEIAFVMGGDLKGPGLTVADVVRKIDSAHQAFEIVDCRYSSWKIKRVDLVADNGASSRFVLGARARSPREVDFPTLGMAMSKNEEVVVSGSGAAVMGNPLNALTFLANEMGRRDRGLVAGDIILSGALSAMLTPSAGECYRSELSGFGAMSVRFIRKGAL